MVHCSPAPLTSVLLTYTGKRSGDTRMTNLLLGSIDCQHAHNIHNADDTVTSSPAMRYASTGPDTSYDPAFLRLPEEHPISNADAQQGMRRSVLQW